MYNEKTMKKDIKVAVVQTKVPASKTEGEFQVRRLIKEIMKEPVDLFGLPEGCLTDNYEEIKSGYNALDFLSKQAKENKIYLFGATAVWENNGFRNRGFLFNREGELFCIMIKLF